MKAMFVTLTCAALATVAIADGTATLALTSDNAGTAAGYGVGPNSVVPWTISVEVTGANSGLALVAVDLQQDAGNPIQFDLTPGLAAAGMEQFDAPAGIVNPAGFGGTLISQNLVQIGGAQNTFGQAGSGGLGQDPTIAANVGIGAPQDVAEGSITIPAAAAAGDVYTFSLENGLANVLDSVGAPPAYSPVSSATVAYAPQSISFIVRPLGDVNCDGAVDTRDIDAFVAALTGTYETVMPNCDASLADTNQDGLVDTRDIDAFVAILTS